MKEEQAQVLLQSQGYHIDSAKSVPEGNSHYVFDVSLSDGKEVIAKFERKSRTAPDGEKRDFHYNGVLSLEREVALCDLVTSMGLPAPKIDGVYEVEEAKFFVESKLPGKCWAEYLKDNGHSLSAFLQSLEYLGADIAQVQQEQFNSFGDVFGKGKVVNSNNNLANRLRYITDLKINREEQTKAFSDHELNEVKDYFDKIIGEIAQSTPQKPVFIVTDLHPMNFFVDDYGKPSGYFDLEFCQAGVPTLEFYHNALHLFNYYDTQSFEQGRNAFFKGFHNAGGNYDLNDHFNQQLETMLCSSHLLACATAYHGAKDGLRDNWSSEFKELFFQTLATGKVPYVSVADIFRTKTQQPNKPTTP